MRTFVRRLPVLTLVLAAGFAGPAGAADDSGVAIYEQVVRVAARAAIAGVPIGGGAAPDGCVWEVAIVGDRLPVFTAEGEMLVSDTGRWFRRVCAGVVVGVNGFFVTPEGGGFVVPDLAEQAFDALDPISPVWSASPNGTTVPMLVQLPTWLWVEPRYWNGVFIARVETPSGRVWAEAQGRPVSALWATGDGQTVFCGVGGTVWAPGAPTRPPAGGCSHTYRHSSAGTEGRAVTVTVNFAVEGATTTNPGAVPLGVISRTSPPVVVQVAEIQAVQTKGQ